MIVGDFNIAAERRDLHPCFDLDQVYGPEELAVLHSMIAAYPGACLCACGE